MPKVLVECSARHKLTLSIFRDALIAVEEDVDVEGWARVKFPWRFTLHRQVFNLDVYELRVALVVVPTVLPKAKAVPKPPASPPPVSPLMTTSKAASKAAASKAAASKAAASKATPKVKAMPKPKAVAKVQARVSLKRVLEEDDPMDCS